MRGVIQVVLWTTIFTTAIADGNDDNTDWATAAFAKMQEFLGQSHSGTKNGHGKDLRQFNSGFDPSFSSNTKSNHRSSVKTSKTAMASCSHPPPAPPTNSDLKCSTYSGCLVRCHKKHQFPNGATYVQMTCVNNEWKAQGEYDVLPACQPICLPQCQNNGICVAPDQCNCMSGFSGPQCQFEEKPCLSWPPTPANSRKRCTAVGCTIECMRGHQFPGGLAVTNTICQGGVWVPRNKDWQTVPDCEPICDPPCQNEGKCFSHNRCQCPKDFRGLQCQYSSDRCAMTKLKFNGFTNCTVNMESMSCAIKCPNGVEISAPPEPLYTCYYESGEFTPHSVPHCLYGSSSMVKTSYSKSSSTIIGHGTSEFSRVVSAHPGTCIYWTGSHLKTFDGLLLSYKSECAYTLLKDTKGTFTINVDKDLNTCNAGDCSLRLKVYIEDTLYKFENKEGKIILTQNNNQSIPIPVKMSELTVQNVGPIVVIKLAAFGVTMKWDSKLNIQVDVTEHLWNRTAGLCSRMDGIASNDMECRSGKVVDSIPVYLSTWESEFLGKHCNEPASIESPCVSSDLSAEATNFCSKILNDPKFQPCHEVLDKNHYYEACRWDYCASKSSQLSCQTVSIFVNECKRKGVNFDAVWRTDDFCGFKCPGGSIYKQCGPATQATCMSASDVHQPAEFCVEGCYCPDGTVQHEGVCIQKEQCPCQYRGKLFPNGKTINQKCNTCVCQGSQWICTQVLCGARCSAIGDPHYMTFDGKMFDFMGKCSYHLVKTDNLTIEAENIECSGSISEAMGMKASSSPSCTKTITIKYDGSVIKLKQHRELLVNDKDISRLPIKVGNVRIRRLSSIFIAVELETGVLIWWDGVSQVYIDVPAKFKGKTQGLCGTFTSNQKDDFLTPEGDIEQDVAAFANKWKVHDTCPNVESKIISKPCDASPEKRAAAERLCGKLKTGNFTECFWQVESVPFYENCLYDVCSCENDPSTCFCPILASYAHECATHGITLNWRQEIRECGVQCPLGQTFQSCGDSCSHSCSDIALNKHCIPKCVEGCNCPSGQTLDKNGDCIPVAKCPCLSEGEEYPAGAKEARHTNGTELCTCIKAQWICSAVSEAEAKKYPKSAALRVACDESKHLEFTKCEPEEPNTCKNLHVRHRKAPSICKPGCQCKKGYVLDSLTNTCVEPKKCPCHHGGRSYQESATVQEKCNVCKCNGGSWSCSTRVCTGTCSTWGESHFKTFDGRIFDFQGLCSYALVQSKVSPEESFEVSMQSVICGSGGVTCVRSVTIDIGADDGAESITLSKDKKLPPKSSLKRSTIRDLGFFVIVEVFDLGLVVQWDKGTRVYVNVDPKWKNRVRGLCGNFNDNELDDFQTPSGGVVEVSAAVFGDSWRLQPQCLAATDPKDNCASHPSRKAWAAEKCGVLHDIFQPCHSEVPVEQYYDRCMQDTCACDLGGDCECLCTAIAAYAQECNENGVPIKWRSQELCPMQCDEKCSSYSPCISTCPQETCENFLQLKSTMQLCAEEVCVEGCQLKKCPDDQIYSSMQDLNCVPKSSCKPVCMQEGNMTYYEGDLMKQDACHSCHCSHHKSVCQGVPCTTTPEPTTIVTTAFTPIAHPVCVSGWSRWISHKSPKKGSIFTDFEPLDAPQKIGFNCGPEHIVDIKCRTVSTHVDFKDTNELVTCNTEKGLFCNGTAEKPCSNYEVQVLCDCTSTESPKEATPLPWCETGWTEWFNNSHPESDSGDYEHISDIRDAGGSICSQEQIHRIQCKYIDPDNSGPTQTGVKTSGVKGPNKKGLKDYKESNQIVTCKKKQGLSCNNLQQVDSICYDYAIRVFCQCEETSTTSTTTTTTRIATTPEPEITTQSRCPSGYEWRDCLYNCGSVCHSYEATLRAEGFCSNGNECKSGCTKIGEYCDFGQSWRSEDVCVMTEDCTCLANDGSLVQPGAVIYEDECTRCQCVSNNYKCVKVPCLPRGNQVKEDETTTVSEDLVTKEDLILPSESSKTCDYWSSWYNDHSPVNDPFEREGKSTLELISLGFCEDGHVVKIECASKEGEVDYKKTSNLNIKCELLAGLTCYDDEQGLLGKCLDYKVRYYCSCDAPTTEPPLSSTTSMPTTVVTIIPSTLSPPHHCNPDKFIPLIQGEHPLNDAAFSASSSLNKHYKPQKARIIADKGVDYTWLAGDDDTDQYLQVDLNQSQPIYAISVRGNPLTEQFVTSYKILYSNDGFKFSEAVDAYGVTKVFRGPADSISVIKEILPIPFEARFVRINPRTWQNGIAAQIEVFGCAKINLETTSPPPNIEAVCDMEMGLGDGRLQDAQITVSSVLKGDSDKFGPNQARLNGQASWTPNSDSQQEWIMINFMGPRELTGIATQGDAKSNSWVTAYYVQYSQDEHQWNKILDQNQNEQAFLGNVDAKHVVRNNFNRVKMAQYLKIIPIKWHGHISMRIEVYGCFDPYPSLPQVSTPAWTTPIPAECTFCPNLPHEKKESCSPCSDGLAWNGESCVPQSDCSCYVGHLEYPVGSVYELEDCLKCTCTLGGVPQCQPKVCPPCNDPAHQSSMTPTCACLCKPCPEGSVICPTSKVCVPKEQWCDGIDHCTDDEVNCTKTTLPPLVPTCPPEPKCEDGFVLKKTKKKKVGSEGRKVQLLRCPIYECLPEPEDHFCLLEGKTLITFDNTTLQAEICDHILAQEQDQWNITATKSCLAETGTCSVSVKISQQNYTIKLNPDFAVEFNGYTYDIPQTQTIAARFREFEISKLGDKLLFESNHFGFALIYNQDGDVQIMVPNKLQGKVNGLCGLLNGDASDDKSKPDGSIAASTNEFVNSWKVQDSQVYCMEMVCNSNHQDMAYKICMEIKQKGKSLKDCQSYVHWDHFLSVCIEKTCECLKDEREQVCRCKAATNYVTQCSELNPPNLDLSNWRVELGCAIDCPPGQIHYDCYRHKCEPSCSNLNTPCPVDKNVCYPGCFCQEGLVKKGDKCVKPEECKDCVCDGFGDPQYLTYDRMNYTFNGNCSYIASRDISDNGEHQFEIIVTNVECIDEPGTTCTEGVTILHQGHVVNMRRLEGHNKILTTLDGEPITKFPVDNNLMKMESIPKKQVVLFLKTLKIEVAYMYFNHAFNIRLPSQTFANKTEGLCGNCNKDKSDDMKTSDGVLSGDINEFGSSWLVKNLPKGILFEENCKVKTVEECMPLPPDEDPCLWIMDEDKFGKCHQMVDPLSYIQACQYDVCHSKNRQASACRDVEAYARECQRHGLCLDWRSDGLCPFDCPAGFEYKPCGSGCEKTCTNADEKCDFEDVEGCFCPAGHVVKDKKCVPESSCKACDNEGHHLGDEWNPDKCTTCRCEATAGTKSNNNSTNVKCTVQTCSPIVCDVGQYSEVVPGTENDCCKKEICMEKAKESCPLLSPPECGLNQELKNLAAEFDCPEFVCQCIPKEKCPPIRSSSNFEFVEVGFERPEPEPGMVRKINESGCCPHEIFVCEQDKCLQPKCPEFFEIEVVGGTEGKCCPIKKCVPPKDKCIFEPNYIAAELGGERTRDVTEKAQELHIADTTWFESPCRRCKCKIDKNEIPTVQCALKTCPPAEDAIDYELNTEWKTGACCPKHVRTACKVGAKVFKENEKWTSESDPCKVYECKTETGVLQKTVTVTECKKNCDLGWQYAEAEAGKCCGKCVQTACVIEDKLHSVGETWKSDDNCTTFTCEKSGDHLQVAASSKTCESVEGCPIDKLKKSEDGCCQFCEKESLSRTECEAKPLKTEVTVALITEYQDDHGKCINTQPITNYRECIGSCQSGTHYNRYDGIVQISDCNCCQGLEYEFIEVNVTCEDGHQYKKKLRVPLDCSCRECTGGGGTKKSPTKTKTTKFLSDIPAQ